MSLTDTVVKILKVVPAVENAVLGLLPVRVATWVRGARKAVVTAAGGALTLLAAAQELPLPANIATVVAGVVAVATVLVTYWAPNEQA